MKILKILALAVLVAGFFPLPGHAGGLYLYEIGTPDIGLASAGYAARAQDASTAFTNPAGMTRLKVAQVQFGAQPMFLHVKFKPDANTGFGPAIEAINGPLVGENGDASGWIPAAGVFITAPLNPDLSLGFSLAGNFGLAIDYGDTWVGRYYLKDVLVQGVTLAPALAYRISDRVSIGASLNAMYGMLDQTVAVNNVSVLIPGFPDGELKVKDEVWGFGGTLGVMVEPRPGTRIGATYMTRTRLDFASTAKFSGLSPVLEAALGSRGLLDANLKLPMEPPQAVMLSAFHQMNDRLAIMGNLGWQDWSQFGKLDVSVAAEDTSSLTVDRQYKDTWHAALGLQYQLSEPWLLSAGIAYDSEMVDEKNLTPDLPTGASWRVGAGGQYAWSQAMTLTCGYDLIWMGDLSMDVNRGPLAGRVSGDYEGLAIHAFVFGMNWNF